METETEELKWYYRLDEDEELGPVLAHELEDLVREGQLGAEDKIRDEDSSLWRAVRRVPRFASLVGVNVAAAEEDPSLSASETLEGVNLDTASEAVVKAQLTDLASEAAQSLLVGEMDGEFENRDPAEIPFYRRTSTLVIAATLLIAAFTAFSWGSVETYKNASNQTAHQAAVKLLDKMEAAYRLGSDSPEWQALQSQIPKQVDDIRGDIFKSRKATGSGNLIDWTLDAMESAAEPGGDSQRDTGEYLEQARTRMSYATLSFRVKIDSLRGAY
ncbi:GYF domain-containing protein [Calycomorphotria hydatis]|uniref:GYF domain-containing protein n=1 Tax=Calycomorphotria hydatis TaxID=2528027 RepID=A0A517T5S6_9PLAN|nr:GYF domain-containing protein [Calycomorphotria hydatis]QDT63735.1 hypothetical protein V22_09600 [Calycomorphotria hydatis]